MKYRGFEIEPRGHGERWDIWAEYRGSIADFGSAPSPSAAKKKVDRILNRVSGGASRHGPTRVKKTRRPTMFEEAVEDIVTEYDWMDMNSLVDTVLGRYEDRTVAQAKAAIRRAKGIRR